MDNELSQSAKSKEKTHTQHFGAHSGSHAGLSDYNDGGKISDYSGNNDSFASENEEEDFYGKVAYGNNNESPDEDEDYGKYHSGL